MAEVRLPAGVSLQQVAETLGVSVDALRAHTDIEPEAVAPVDRVVQVPDGFLRSRRKSRELQDAVTQDTARKSGMNMWLALDIEHKKTRIESALGYQASDDDVDSLHDAIRAFERIDAESNRMALDLATPLTRRARSLELRGVAAALVALAHVATYKWFGGPSAAAKLAALSQAKAAITANPRMARAKVAMGTALAIEARGADRDGALEEIYEGVQGQPDDGFAWAALADVLCERGDLAGAHPAAEQAVRLAPESSYVAEVAGRVAMTNGDPQRAAHLFRQALRRSPSNGNAGLQLGFALIASGQPAAGRRELRMAIDSVVDPGHRRWLQDQQRRGSWAPRA